MHARRPGEREEWSFAIGTRRAAVSVLWRTAVVLGLWLLVLYGLHALAAALAGGDAAGDAGDRCRGIGRIAMIAAAVTGIAGGFTLGRGLSDVAGFSSPVVSAIAAIGAAIAFIGGDALFAQLAEPSSDMTRFIATGVAMIVALGWIAYETLFGE
jgi:hypothetical protein